MRYFFILNPISGHTYAPDFYERKIAEVMRAAKKEFEIRRTVEKEHARALAQKAASEGWDAVVAVGGDGTVNEAGSALIGSRSALGIIPKGSGNGLAGELGLPRDNPALACRMLLDSKAQPIDTGRVNGRIFLNLAGVGLDACVGHAFNAGSHRRGRLPYFYMTVREMLRYRPPIIHVETAQEKFSLEALLIVVANGRQYGSGAVIAPQARLNDALFHVTLAGSMPLWKAALASPRLFLGTVDKAPGVRTIAAGKIKLVMEKPNPYHLDGEPFWDGSELSFEVLPATLRLLAPAGRL